MRAFTELYVQLDQTTSTTRKVAALCRYFETAPAADAAWAIWFLTGRRLKRLVKRSTLREAVLDATGYPEWLLDECYQQVGDTAESIALLLPEPPTAMTEELSLALWITNRIQPLSEMTPVDQRSRLRDWWGGMAGTTRFVLNKLLTGALRVGVSQQLVTRALGEVLGHEPAVVAHRLMGDWAPTADFYNELGEENAATDISRPYPFYLASPITEDIATLGDVGEWAAEWKWDGIRAQLIRRQGKSFLWSRGEERLDGRFPEIELAGSQLPDGCVLDGEILAAAPESPERYQFSLLQRRIGRKKPGPKILAEAPVSFMVYDLLEQGEADLRDHSLLQRRERLQNLISAAGETALLVSPLVHEESWDGLMAAREQSRELGVEGLMLKRWDSVYQTGRRRGAWWKWKIDPYTIDLALIYAQPGSGRRSNQFTDYTFAARKDGEWVTVCKAYTGLSQDEIKTLDRWIRANTVERFGPVRSVTPTHVFELAFEGVQRSKRHKSGVAFRFPRIVRWRTDLSLDDVDSVNQIEALIDE